MKLFQQEKGNAQVWSDLFFFPSISVQDTHPPLPSSGSLYYWPSDETAFPNYQNKYS
jgi:hypothetical protein